MGRTNTKEGPLIVIEGIDGAGKGTQTGLMEKRLAAAGQKVKVFDFPRYEESMAGKLVGRMLMGDFGDPSKISPYLTCLPYVCDETTGSREITKWVKKGGVALSNRYVTSNVHQIGKMEPDKRVEFRYWFWDFAYKEMGIRKPDMVAVLLVDIPICRDNIEKKAARNYTGGQQADLVERDVQYQINAAEEYQRMAAMDPSWVVFDCCENGHMLPPEQINDMVFEQINRRKVLA
ncbi:MAG TPA: hypothetical protein VF828_00330 [Patescibacteria group bacterium]